jgi:hypothetical protein
MNGIWHGKVVGDLFIFALQLKIEGDGAGWKGQVNFSADGKEDSCSLRDLKYADKEVSFETELRGNKLHFRGTVGEGKMSGTAEIKEVRGLKIEWDVVSAPRPEGKTRPPAETSEIAVDEKVVGQLPRPTGASAVGRVSRYWKDSSRPEVLIDDPRAKRELMVDLWYPAHLQEGSEPAPYVPDAEAIAKAGADSSLPFARLLRTNAVADAPPAGAPRRFTVLVFSHGMGFKSAYYSALLEELASYGYVVAAIQHTYDTSAVVFPDGRLMRFAEDKWKASQQGSEEKALQFFRGRMDVWSSDAIFVLNQLAKLDKGTPESALKGRLDLSRVGIFGHSFGGIAAAEACQRDDRFKACINMDGMREGQVVLSDEKARGLRQPFLYMSRRPVMTESELAIMGLTRDQYAQLERKHLHRMFAPLEKRASNSFVALLEKARHMSFSDEPLFSPKSVPQPLEVRLRTTQIIRDLTRQFFDRHVRGDASVRWPADRAGLLVEPIGASSTTGAK